MCAQVRATSNVAHVPPLSVPSTGGRGAESSPQLFFADDSRPREPTRRHMRENIIGAGGFQIREETLEPLTVLLDSLCTGAGFPPGEEFKWSPNRRMWMYKNLVGEDRAQFFDDVLTVAGFLGVTVAVVVSDTWAASPVRMMDHEHALTTLLLERAHNGFSRTGARGTVIFDRPGGGRRSARKFLTECYGTVTSGTAFATLKSIEAVQTGAPEHARALQLADLVTSCTLARVAGEQKYSLRIFKALLPLFGRDAGRIGGIGLKIHPDFRYGNLYHWLLGDTVLVKRWQAYPLPHSLFGPHYLQDAGEP